MVGMRFHQLHSYSGFVVTNNELSQTLLATVTRRCWTGSIPSWLWALKKFKATNNTVDSLDTPTPLAFSFKVIPTECHNHGGAMTSSILENEGEGVSIPSSEWSLSAH